MLTSFQCHMGDIVGVSSEIFQKRLHQELQGLPGVKYIADDVLIHGTRELIMTTIWMDSCEDVSRKVSSSMPRS